MVDRRQRGQSIFGYRRSEATRSFSLPMGKPINQTSIKQHMRNSEEEEEEEEIGNPNLYGKEDRQSDRFDTIQLCIVARALVQAYRQALQNASKSGVAQETLQNAVRRSSKVMTEQEARQILNVSETTTWEEVMKRYDTLFENNAKNGTFYLQSKVHRAKECLEAAYQDKGQGTGTPS
ncbi:PREDICTED: mitochondrial import inner membrane [Prunus dulcis]|uniref:PREDICTED: mitochondrial import inner membrane n=2 Tax=Prunus dulcis TaxID=3755 RepID=A0A5E4G4Z2_PRUDU|nr:hypothetical protein L3X38_003437 [Prunus dulcis]VVA34837.1 PREDICTED: mitochondrial import inner membrane [Prunus dulcis]